MKKRVTNIILIISIILIILGISINSYAFDTSAYEDIYKNQGNTKVLNAAGGVLSVFQVVGVATALVMIIVLAIKYMVSSVEEKAEIKKKLIPYIIGITLLFGMSGILGIIKDFADMF